MHAEHPPMLNRQQTVADLVIEHSECAAVFQRHRIDFCCGGDLSVEAAAQAKHVDVEVLVEELSQAIAERRPSPSEDARQWSTHQLVSHIVDRHHGYLRQTLPFVRALAVKVSRVHGDHNPRLRQLEGAVLELAHILQTHLDEEEEALFPALMASNPDRAALVQPLASMLTEHRAVAVLLERVRSAAEEFALPDWACNSYRTLFAELQQMEGDVLKHVHLENHVLKPRFAET